MLVHFNEDSGCDTGSSDRVCQIGLPQVNSSHLLPDLQGISGLCCGMMFDSRGAKQAAGLKVAEMATALSMASQMGKLPIVIDNSPCLATLKSAGMNLQELK